MGSPPAPQECGEEHAEHCRYVRGARSVCGARTSRPPPSHVFVSLTLQHLEGSTQAGLNVDTPGPAAARPRVGTAREQKRPTEAPTPRGPGEGSCDRSPGLLRAQVPRALSPAPQEPCLLGPHTPPSICPQARGEDRSNEPPQPRCRRLNWQSVCAQCAPMTFPRPVAG